jgi:uncharacterized protein (DUF433 family)
VIVSDPEIINGTLCFRGTRVPFENLIDHLEEATMEVVIPALEQAKESLLARIA